MEGGRERVEKNFCSLKPLLLLSIGQAGSHGSSLHWVLEQCVEF